MKRIALVFLVAILLPGAVLGFLALRAASQQGIILERQTAALYQNDADSLATQLGDAILGSQREFADRVRDLLTAAAPESLAGEFPSRMTDAGIPFAVDPAGSVVIAKETTPGAHEFLASNASFFNSREPAEVFRTNQNAFSNAVAGKIGTSPLKQDVATPETTPLAESEHAGTRKVLPQKAHEEDASQLLSQISNFQNATNAAADGVLARFTGNRLELIFWTRPPEAKGYVFALALPADLVAEFVRKTFPALALPSPGTCLAILDENARPVAISAPGFTTDWKRPFVATGIGELLPHWEAAVYLLHPGELAASVRVVRLTLILLVVLALAAILSGGLFVAWDTRRQLALAQKKTDFVSNVSHELKTPLTSIRMFAELLEDGRAEDSEKRDKYLRIIRLEAERLTRLIHNVLDFAQLEKKRRRYDFNKIDILKILVKSWEFSAEHLREEGFACNLEMDTNPLVVQADGDALGQVFVNLLSNAEKYSPKQREISVVARRSGTSVVVQFLDRGIGIAESERERIFEAFHRSNDLLSSGIQGSGLGLTLARRIAEDHGGTLTAAPREGGGAVLTLRLPLAEEKSS